MTEHKAAVLSFLTSRGITPTSSWLDECVSSQRAGVSLQQLQQTALFRLLASDITSSIQKSGGSFPNDVTDPEQLERRLVGPILVQLLDIEDIGSSAWSQVEAIEAQERGETTRGNQVIRAVPDENGEAPQAKSKGPHKMLFEDIAGNKVYAFDMSPIKELELGCSIGLKAILRNIHVARGMVLLRPEQIQVLGGRIDAYHNTWQAERKQRLQQKVEG